MREIDFQDGGKALLRNLTPDDISYAVKLCRAAGWNQIKRDWERLVSFEPDGCFALEIDGNTAGTATTTTYGRRTAWIGMVLVDPAVRGRGLGRTLLNACIDYLKSKRVGSIKLDATPAGESLYKSLGFQVCRKIERMNGTTSRGKLPAGVRKVSEKDLPAIVKMDKKAFGADRGNVIRALFEDYPEKSLVAEENGVVVGAVLGRDGAKARQIGPLVAEDDEICAKLLEASLALPPAGNCIIDVPEESIACREILKTAGFKVERPLTRMCLGTDTAREHWGVYHIIHCPELG